MLYSIFFKFISEFYKLFDSKAIIISRTNHNEPTGGHKSAWIACHLEEGKSRKSDMVTGRLRHKRPDYGGRIGYCKQGC